VTARFLSMLIAAALAGGCTVPPGAGPTPVEAACPAETAGDATRWLAAVETGQEAEALRLAAILAPAGRMRPADPAYAAFFTAEGMDPAFLAAGFGHWDYQAWSHAAFFAGLARDTVAGQADADRALFEAVAAHLTDPDPPNPGAFWPFRIWQAGRGFCDRQAWVLAELFYQQGADVKIVYLRDPVTLESPHTITQVRHEGRAMTADPLSEVALPGVTVAQVARDPELARRLWPDNRSWQSAITAAALWVPAYPQDYAPRNQLLQERLRACLGTRAPRFGEDPAARLQAWPAEREGMPTALWFYPLRLLNWEMLYG
jgi:hypothetical protein